jgi:hypothetical protein
MRRRFREWLAFKIAPWVYVPYREEREEAFRDLAVVAYGSPRAVWTSPTTLVRTALERARWEGAGLERARREVSK